MSVSYAASRTTPIFHAVSIIIWDCRQESINSLCQSEPCKKNFLMLYLVCYWNFFTGRIYMKRRINILCLIALLLSFVLPYYSTPSILYSTLLYIIFIYISSTFFLLYKKRYTFCVPLHSSCMCHRIFCNYFFSFLF